MKTSKNRSNVVFLTELAVLTAVVLILQLGGIAIPLPFLATPVSLVLLPIVLGGMHLGPGAGAWLGAVFGIITIIGGVSGKDAFTAILLGDHPILTVLLCLIKAIAAGLIAGLVYKALKKKNEYLALYTASVLAPVINTGIFILGALAMSDTLSANFVADGQTVIYFLVIGCAGLNFVFELLVNVLFAPALKRVTDVLGKGKI
ncbi:MAG: ECF transporter S component [Clostridia bacterium]|nr:ECF transporter S component [Clostridia bacterium]